MTDSTYSILADPKISHSVRLTIYKPDATVYFTVNTDSINGSGDAFAVSTSKALDFPPTSVVNIHTSVIPQRLLNCGQLSGLDVLLELVSGGAPKPTMRGVIGKTSVEGNHVSLEIIPNLALLDKQPGIKLLNNCPLVFGSSECGVTTLNRTVSVLTANANFTILTIPPTFFAPSIGSLIAVKIGSTQYRVLSLGYNGGGSLESITLDRSCRDRPDFVVLGRTCNQSIAQCQKYGNSTHYRGVVLPASVLSLVL